MISMHDLYDYLVGNSQVALSEFILLTVTFYTTLSISGPFKLFVRHTFPLSKGVQNDRNK